METTGNDTALARRRRYAADLRAVSDLDDNDLAALILDPLQLLHETAVTVMLKRCEPLMIRRSCTTCGRLGHGGHKCPGAPCDRTFPSSMSRLGRGIVGRPVIYAFNESDSIIAITETERKTRTDSRNASVVRRWVEATAKESERANQELPSLYAMAGGYVKKVEKDAEIRQQWNKDRGLKVKANVPKSEEERLGPLLRSRLEEATTDRTISDIPLGKWADVLYDDACDVCTTANANHLTDGGIDVRRVGRRLEWPIESETDIAEAKRILTAVERVLQEIRLTPRAGTDPVAGHFYDTHFGLAYAHTRSSEFSDAEGISHRGTDHPSMYDTEEEE